MKQSYNADARRRTANLTLNEDFLSVVESLAAEYLHKEKRRRAARQGTVESTVALWNRLDDESGSFADAHSTL
jgi:post-segregation antitoxin (ccd killing protein)